MQYISTKSYLFFKSGDKMDWIVSSTVLLRGPMCLLILFAGEKLGLKRWLHISSVLAIGGIKSFDNYTHYIASFPKACKFLNEISTRT